MTKRIHGYDFPNNTSQEEQENEKGSLLDLIVKLRAFNESIHQQNLRLGDPAAIQEEHQRRYKRR